MTPVERIFPIFLFAFPCYSLICPIYNIDKNETDFIQFCNESTHRCSYSIENSTFRRCLGLYQFEKDQIVIRQLAVLDDFENRYINRTECILEIDRTGQNLLCRCNSDRCTLNWRTSNNVSNQLFNQKKGISSPITEEKLDKNWFLPLMMLCSTVTLAGIVITAILLIPRFRKSIDKDLQPSNITDLSTTDFNELFLSSSIVTRGKHSVIYRTSSIDQTLAIKLYQGNQSKYLFENESIILRMVRHSSIISLIGSGWHGTSPYIVMEYHPLGSLQNYLGLGKFSWTTCFSMLHSLLQAIDYLHYEDLSANDYFSSNRVKKPVIIHRDIKSSNIVVKSSPIPSVCLIDFGLAKALPPILTAIDFIQIGTFRYMAPELLELAISYTSEALCKVDMYATGLVMWEIVSQCDEYPCSVEYRLPYVEYLQNDETNENRCLDILHRIVVNERKRPILHRTSTIDAKMIELFSIIEDCWKHEPEFRINARPALTRLRRIQ